MNVDVPPFECSVRSEFLYDQRTHHGEFTPALVFGLTSIQGRAIGWWAVTDRGAMIGRLPIHALVWKEHPFHIPHDHLELWDCLSYHPHVHVWTRLALARVRYVDKGGTWRDGEYQFTVDFYGGDIAESPGETGWKCAHVIKLDCGCYAAQPNNRLLWYDPSWVANPYDDGERPEYLVNSTIWKVESVSKWHTENSRAWFYEIRSPENGIVGRKK